LVDEKTVGRAEEIIEVLDEKSVSIVADPEKDRAKDDAIVPPTTIDTGADEQQTTFTQSQSLLFRKLPPELRGLIWRECVGDLSIYLGVIQEEKRIRHCKIFEGRGLMRLSIDQDEQDRLMEEHYFIPLLQTCRRM
jgi:hypothetical protein